VAVVRLRVGGLSQRHERLPGDAQDRQRDGQPDQRIAELEADGGHAALATTARLTRPSTRAWLPSAMSAGGVGAPFEDVARDEVRPGHEALSVALGL
jgi:hypothetical protein